MNSQRSPMRKMWLSCLLASSLVVMATAQGNEYLPPSKGYNYEPPRIPFPTNTNGFKQPKPSPRPGPFRPAPSPGPQKPTYVPPPSGPIGPPAPTNPPSHDHHHHHDEHDHHHHHEPGMPFDFAYAVNEDGNQYSHNAASDGDLTKGEYRVALPDGRTQIVRYTADWRNGFNAEVTYEGEAQYPDQPIRSQGYGSAATGQAYAPASQGGGYQY